jgi:hypothetical protein
MTLIRIALVLALAMVTLEVLTGGARDPLPPIDRSSPSPSAPTESTTPTPSADPSPTPSPVATPVPSEQATPSATTAAACFEIAPPLLVACPGDRIERAGWEIVLPDGWAAIAPDAEFLPSLLGPGTEAGPFLNELGARATARGISAVVLGRSARSIDALGLGSSESVRTLLAARYPDRTVAISAFSRSAGGRVFATGTLTRDGLASRFVLLAIADTPSLTRIALAWAPWSSASELYAVIGAE